MLPSTERLVDEVRRRGRVPTRQLARELEVTEEEFPDLVTALMELQKSGRLVRIPETGWVLPEQTNHRVGILRLDRRGRGRVHLTAPEGFQVVEIRDGRTGTALHGDVVLVEIQRAPPPRGKKRRRGPGPATLRGRVVDVIERRREVIRGRYRVASSDGRSRSRKSGPGIVEPLERRFASEVFIPPGKGRGARDGQKVLVRLLEGSELGIYPRGEVVHVIEGEGSLDSDFEMIAAEFGFPVDAPPEAVAEAARLDPVIGSRQLEGREDLRDLRVFTIDPEDSRDFDDAVSLEITARGRYRLGVHIADVAHHVPPGSALDVSARERGTSIYLPGRVVAMLPDRLSSDLASLQPGEDRLTKSVFIEFDRRGSPIESRLTRSVIRSCRRFTYDEVLMILEEIERRRSGSSGAAEKDPALPADYPDYLEVLEKMAGLRDLLRQRRLERGCLELAIPRLGMLVDPASGEVLRLTHEARDPSRALIEEFMVAANEAVAAYLVKRDLPLLWRVHANPSEEGLELFFDLLDALGMPHGRGCDAASLQEILGRVEGEALGPLVHMSFLRSLPHAEYVARPGRHFALATDAYCHFTSPIRRYPDLLIHQILDEHWDGQLREGRRRQFWTQELARLAADCSNQEKRAEEAEREMLRLRLIRHLAHLAGEEMEATVVAVHPFGFFVQEKTYLLDGLVPVSSLGDDYYEHEPEKFRLRGRWEGRTLTVGDRVRVRLEELDADLREIRFRYVGPAGEVPRRAAGKERERTTRRRGRGV